MATLRATVQLSSLPEDIRQKNRLFIISGNFNIGATAGRLERRLSSNSQPYDSRDPLVPNALALTSQKAATFSSSDISGQPTFADALSRFIELGYIVVDDLAAPGVALTRADIQALI